jgi:protein SCO1/2
MKWLVSSMLALAVLVGAERSRADAPAPPEANAIDVTEHLGAQLSRDLAFVDSEGRAVALGSYFTGRRPVVLTLVYFECPMFCNLVLNGLAKSIRSSGLVAGRDFDLLTVSFDPRDEYKTASARRKHYLDALGLADEPGQWPFLTGGPSAIRDLANGVGFGYAPVPHAREFAHPAVSFVLTPSGVVSRYLYGVEPPSRDLRLAVAEASRGKAGSSFDRFLLQCYRYDPATRRYGVYISAFLRVGGLLVFGALSSLLFVLWRREARGETSA